MIPFLELEAGDTNEQSLFNGSAGADCSGDRVRIIVPGDSASFWRKNSTAIRLGRSYREGAPITPKRTGCAPGRGKLAPFMDFLIEVVEAVKDITSLYELSAALLDAHAIQATRPQYGVRCTEAGSHIKKSVMASELSHCT